MMYREPFRGHLQSQEWSLQEGCLGDAEPRGTGRGRGPRDLEWPVLEAWRPQPKETVHTGAPPKKPE